MGYGEELIRDENRHNTRKMRSRSHALQEVAHLAEIPIKTVKYKMRAVLKFVHILKAYGPGYLVLLTSDKRAGVRCLQIASTPSLQTLIVTVIGPIYIHWQLAQSSISP